ncbi:MAG: MATE family efflux transporter [Gemmatimonadaceae bacterium]|nr:MATE family efflux transporter [Gemmatimonadaceae bacterium]
MSVAAGALVDDALPRVIRRVAIPAVASNLLMTLFASMDAYWVGTRIGPTGLAAVSTGIFWVWLVVSIAEGVALGVTALAARRHGEGRPEEAARVAGGALFFALALGAVVGLAGAFSVGALFAFMQTPPEVTALARDYLRTYFLGLPLIYGFFCVDATFRASGDTRTPLLLLSVSVACTLLLDPVLILGLGPAPRLGIEGAAVALVATRGAAFAIGVWLLRRRGMLLAPGRHVGVEALHLSELHDTPPAPVAARGSTPTSALPRIGDVRAILLVAQRVLRIGLPTAVTGVIFSFIYVAMTRTTTHFGTPALAALGLGHRIESWLYMFGVGFGATAAAVVGQNLGARRVERAERAGWITMAFAMAPALVMAIASLAIPETLARVFTNDPTVVDETALYLRINALSQLLLPAEVVLEGALGGAGDTVPPMITSTALTAMRIPLAAWWASLWGPVGIWWAISVTAAGRGVAMMLLWRSGRWKRKTV